VTALEHFPRVFPCPRCGKPAGRVFRMVFKKEPGDEPGPNEEGFVVRDLERVEQTDRWLCTSCGACSATPEKEKP